MHCPIALKSGRLLRSMGPRSREIIMIHFRSNPKWQTCQKLYVAHSSEYSFSGAKRGRV